MNEEGKKLIDEIIKDVVGVGRVSIMVSVDGGKMYALPNTHILFRKHDESSNIAIYDIEYGLSYCNPDTNSTDDMQEIYKFGEVVSEFVHNIFQSSSLDESFYELLELTNSAKEAKDRQFDAYNCFKFQLAKEGRSTDPGKGRFWTIVFNPENSDKKYTVRIEYFLGEQL